MRKLFDDLFFRRTRLMKVHDCIVCAMTPIRKTRIMGRANIAFTFFKPLLAMMLEKGFIRREGKLVVATPSGIAFADRIKAIHDEFGLHDL